MQRWLIGIVIVGAAAIAFVVGRMTVRASAASNGPGPAATQLPRPRLGPTVGSERSEPQPPAVMLAPDGSGSGSTTDGSGTGSDPRSLAECTDALHAARDTIARDEDDRLATQGAPIALPATDAPPRFTEKAVSGAVKSALAQARARGGIDGTDCEEYPCIVYGRINGTEDDVEPIEQARAFDAYDDDLSTIILWVQTDEAAEEAARRSGRRDKHQEQMLFAIAFYSQADAASRGDDLDRRIRSRVTDLWNAMSPSDETGTSR